MSTVNGSSLIEPQGETTTHTHHTRTQHTQGWLQDCGYANSRVLFGPVKFRSKHFHEQIQLSVTLVDCQDIPLLQQLSCALPNPKALHPTKEL